MSLAPVYPEIGRRPGDLRPCGSPAAARRAAGRVLHDHGGDRASRGRRTLPGWRSRSGEKVAAGAVVIATGPSPTARRGEFGTGIPGCHHPAASCTRWLADDPGRRAESCADHGKRTVALIHCVGSRQIEGVHAPQADGKVNEYCSRVCCTAALQAADEIASVSRSPHLRRLPRHPHLRPGPRGVLRARLARGARCSSARRGERPVVEQRPGTVRDGLTWNEEVEVLGRPGGACHRARGPSIRAIVEIAQAAGRHRRLPAGGPPQAAAGRDRGRRRLPRRDPARPQGPRRGRDRRPGAAAKAAILLAREEISGPFVAVVDEERCDGCETVPRRVLLPGRDRHERAGTGPRSTRRCARAAAPAWRSARTGRSPSRLVARAARGDGRRHRGGGAMSLSDATRASLEAAKLKRGTPAPPCSSTRRRRCGCSGKLREVLAGEQDRRPRSPRLTGLDAAVVLFQVTAMRKYGKVEERAAGDYLCTARGRSAHGHRRQTRPHRRGGAFGAFDIDACFNCGNCTAVCPLSEADASLPAAHDPLGQLGQGRAPGGPGAVALLLLRRVLRDLPAPGRAERVHGFPAGGTRSRASIPPGSPRSRIASRSWGCSSRSPSRSSSAPSWSRARRTRGALPAGRSASLVPYKAVHPSAWWWARSRRCSSA